MHFVIDGVTSYCAKPVIEGTASYSTKPVMDGTTSNFTKPVIPAQAGIQQNILAAKRATVELRPASRVLYYQLDSRLMELLAIRLSWQTTPAKSLVMRGNDGLGNQTGFTYIGLLIIIAIMGVTLAGIGTVWHTSQQRFREKQLLFIGNQYSRAIIAYYQNTPGAVKQFPKKLEDLLQDKRQPTTERYLRKLFADPITDSEKWGLIKAADGSIAGVYSLSEAEPIKKDNFPKSMAKFANKMHYSEWKFSNSANGFAPQISSAIPPLNGGNAPAPKVPPAYQVPTPDPLPENPTPEDNNLWECQSQRMLDAAICLQQLTKYGDTVGLACMATANQRYTICITPGHTGLPPLYLLFK